MTGKKVFTERNSNLVKEFDRYILEHPEFADQIPDNALVVMQIEGDDDYAASALIHLQEQQSKKRLQIEFVQTIRVQDLKTYSSLNVVVVIE